MLRTGLGFLAIATAGVLIFATGVGGFGPCGPDGAGTLAAIMVLLGGPIGFVLTSAAGIHRLWKRHRGTPAGTVAAANHFPGSNLSLLN